MEYLKGSCGCQQGAEEMEGGGSFRGLWEVGNLNNEGEVKRRMPPRCKMIIGDQPLSPVMRNREVRGTVRMKGQDGRFQFSK